MKRLFLDNSIIGKIVIVEEDGKICGLFFNEEDYFDGSSFSETKVLKEAASQIKEYLNGRRKNFDLPLCFLEGTEFQRKVWEALLAIPYGETRSYKEIAAMIGNPKAARAVGMANNRNPISIIVPCHRVIGADGSLVGYGGGLDNKKKLLEIEKSHK